MSNFVHKKVNFHKFHYFTLLQYHFFFSIPDQFILSTKTQVSLLSRYEHC